MREIMNTYNVTVSSGKTVRVTAPSPQRAQIRIERTIRNQGLKLTVASVQVIG